jgi:vacuolar-type H+-ATPase subunit I/STV1
MRARKSGGIAPFVSPSPAVTPAVYVQTPVMSPFPQFTGLADEANQEWGVNGYGSMNGLIRLRSTEMLGREDCADNDDTESDVEQDAQSVQKLEERLDHDVSRFVMTYPNDTDAQNIGQNLLETRMDDQYSHIAHLEEENLDLKERLHVMQQEVEDLRRRMQVLEGVGDEEEADSTGRMTADLSCL